MVCKLARLRFVYGALLTCMLMSGCDRTTATDADDPEANVKGTVTLDGKPWAGVTVLHVELAELYRAIAFVGHEDLSRKYAMLGARHDTRRRAPEGCGLRR